MSFYYLKKVNRLNVELHLSQFYRSRGFSFPFSLQWGPTRLLYEESLVPSLWTVVGVLFYNYSPRSEPLRIVEGRRQTDGHNSCQGLNLVSDDGGYLNIQQHPIPRDPSKK